MKNIRPSPTFVGRAAEISVLRRIGEAKVASIAVVHGRRRVGKTSLIQHTFRTRNLIKFEGIEGQSQDYQIQSFLKQLAAHFQEPLLERIRFSSWREPLIALAERVQQGTVTIFLEELQWLANYDSRLISELKFVWDNYLQNNPKLVLILCGSAPSFMVNEVLRSRALYNRSLHEIALQPLTCSDTQRLLGKSYNKKHALEAQLLVGGIPEYIKYLKTESSPYLSFCRHSFMPNGFFVDEPTRLFVSSLAGNPHYREIIQLIGRSNIISREEVLAKLKLSSGSNITKIFRDLESCGFITLLRSFNSSIDTKLVRYEIADPFLRIYYKYIEKRLKQINAGTFKQDCTIPLTLRDYYQTLGYSFEQFCRRNAHLIAQHLSFGAVEYEVGPLLNREIHDGVQLDLIFSRKDKVVTVCELKYFDEPLAVHHFKNFTSRLSKLKLSDKQRLERVLVSPGEVTETLRTSGLFDRFVGLEAFFD